MIKSSGHIFISYAREDRDRVAVLVRLFENEGWSVWWDRDSLPAGRRFGQIIDQAIQDASCVLVCWSGAALDSDWVLDEADEAKQQDKLVPVYLDLVKLPYGHRSYHCLDLSEWNNQATHQAYLRLKSELSQKQPLAEPVKPTEESGTSSEHLKLVFPQMQGLVNKLTDQSISPQERLEAGDKLAEIGDPRSGVGLDAEGLPDIDWVEIPGGEYLYGDEKEPASIDTFYMARYPITNLQFQAFIEDGAYDDDDLWIGLPEWKRKPAKSSWSQLNRPATFINWYEATAFCRWLSDRSGGPMQLPTESQWERAVRGTSGRNYPWGDELRSGLANVDEVSYNTGSSNLQQPSTVGLYVLGASPEGVLDLSGNVGEWGQVENEFIDDGLMTENMRFVVRGGSWRGSLANAHASIRLRFFPYKRFGTIGFRVVCSSPTGA